MAQDISFDIIARDKASATFSKISSNSGHTASRLKSFGKIATLAFAGAAVAAGGLAIKLAKSAAEDQQSSALMAKQFRNSAKATDAQISATERWITKQGIAKGVADDQLRPALAQLVVATHDVGKAQHLAGLAMNVSAGKGLALGAVSKALAKAATGNVGALGRLGIATKNADGKTKSFAQITKELGKQFAGQATTKANTLSGKMARLKLIMSETGEAIGYKLIPILTDLATWILNKGIPALDRFGKWFNTNVVPPMKAAADFIQNRIIPAFENIGKGSGRTSDALKQFSANFSSIFSSVKSILSSVAKFAGWFWAHYGDLITKYGIGTLKNLLKEVRGFANILTGIFKVISSVLKGDWGGAWAGIKQITRGAVQVLGAMVGQLWNTVKTLFSAGVRSLGAIMKRLPGLILKAVVGWDKLLINAGKAIISGLISGIESKIGDLVGKLKSITNLIPKHKGPISKDRLLLQPAGRAIMDGLISGIESKRETVKKALEKVTALIQSVGDKLSNLQSIRAGFMSTFSSDSLFGADLSGGGGIDALMAFEQGQASKARQLLADVQKVASMGLSKSLIAQLQAAGSSGADQLHALAGGTSAQIQALNALDVQTSSSLQQAGLTAGNYGRGGSINADIAHAQKQEQLLEAVVRELKRMNGSDTVAITAGDVIKIIKVYNRNHGRTTAGI